MSKVHTTNLKVINDTFPDLLEKLKDLAAIDTTIKFKINNDDILMYAMLMNGKSIMAMKIYLLNTKEYIEMDDDVELDIIFKDGGKFVKQLNFLDLTKEIKWKIEYKEVEDCNHVRSSIITNNKFKISSVGGELSEIKNISKDFLIERLDRNNATWGFVVTGADMANVKKLASIYNEEKAISLEVSDGKVSFAEMSKWDLEVSQVDDSDINETIMFKKSYLGNINMEQENINFDLFETFIMVSDTNSNLILSFEQTYDDED